MKIKRIGYAMAIVVSAAVMAGCSNTPKETPEEVIGKFKAASVEVKSMELAMKMELAGSDAEDKLDFKGEVGVKFDRNNAEERKLDMKMAVKGGMETAGRSLDMDADFNVLTVADDFYVKLDKLESEDPSIKAIQPFIKAYSGDWLKLTPDLIPEGLRQLQPKDEAALTREKELQALFVKANLFEVTKEYGIESVNGHKSYHYGVRLNPVEMQDYLKAVAALNGQTIPENDLQQMDQFAASVGNAELWIGVKDYYLYKGSVDFAPPVKGAEGAAVDMRAKVMMEVDSYNKDMGIKAPEEAEEFNPLALFMGAGAAEIPAPAEEKPLE